MSKNFYRRKPYIIPYWVVWPWTTFIGSNTKWPRMLVYHYDANYLLRDYWEVNSLYSGDFKHILVFEFLLFLKAVLWYTDTFKFRTFASLLQRKVKIQRLGSGQFRVFLVVMWRHHFPKQKHINLCEVLILSDVRPSKKLDVLQRLSPKEFLWSTSEFPSLCVAWHWNVRRKTLSSGAEDDLLFKFWLTKQFLL